MREVTLYEIVPKRMVAASDYLALHRFSMSAIPQELPGREFAVDLDSGVQVDRVPVHHIRQIRNGCRSDKFIAVHPELYDMLLLPVVQPLEEKLSKAETDRQQHQERWISWWKQSWYKRLLSAVVGRPLKVS